ncbi:MAG: AAA family ATPase [Gaiellaceae bacterium]
MSRLSWIEIESFRGFAETCRVGLDADAVIITGPNGVGKTSLIDAITWALTGQVPRLEQHKERRTDDVLTNRYRSGTAPRATLAVVVDGIEVLVSRDGRSADAPTVERAGETSRGNDAVAAALGFRTLEELKYALETWGVLHQDSMRAVLEARPDEFQARLRDILGLGVLGEFESWIKAQCKTATDTVNEARGRLARATAATASAHASLTQATEQVSEAEAPSEARQALEETAARAKPCLHIRLPENSDATAMVLLQETRRLQTEIARRWASYRSLSDSLEAAEARQLADPDELRATLELAASVYEKAQKEAAAAEANLAAFQERLRGLAALAAAVLPHLGSTCPVCEQAIDPDAVRDRLQSLLDQSADRAALTALEDARTAARSAVEAAEQRLAEVRRSQQVAQEQEQEVARLRSERDAQASWFQAITADDELIPIHIGTPTEGLISETNSHLRSLEAALERWQTAVTESAARAQEPALRARAAQQEEQERQARNEVERLAAQELNLKALAAAATEAVVDVTDEWLRELNPLFGAVYNRLAAHPTFTELGLEHDIYYGKGRTLPRVYDRLLDISDNPQLVCSEGQLNIVALSYFIAFALSAGERSLPFLIMDDPLQFMDEINVLGFADLCRQLRASRQILVTTHDRRFARLLERKLRPRQSGETSLQIEFATWERSGPSIEATVREPEPVPELLAAPA